MGTFDTVLVANRGEIAVRILRTARSLGYRTVAVYSDADASAPHVQVADLAVRIGPGPVAESYLSVERLLEAAAKTGAGAVHPGYGFLAENAGFARACAQAGLTFVGPPEPAIALMGDKVQAKRRMIDAGVPTAPGYHGTDQDPERLMTEASAIGVPLLVKAVAGGGGRGMRKVTELAQLSEAIASARSEAASAFGNGDLFLERLVEGARHIEIQVFADTHGNVLHLHERECSAQRRHQKIIEEAPSAVVGDALRRTMGAAAVAAARAIDYVGAGTVEFLLDDDQQFYFLEMNTRLQVEHPVTELITGFDLVAWQLAVAAGERLPVTQGEIPLRGHAIEARLYAEDPEAGFLPQVGRIELWSPARGDGVRVDAGVQTGTEVSPYYDPMLAKVIAHGPTRADAIRRLRSALRSTSALGVTTNRAFLLELLGSDEFATAAIKTDTIDRDWAGGRTPEPVSDRLWALAAVVASHEESTWSPAGPWRSSGSAAWPVLLRNGEEQKTVRVEDQGDERYRVSVEDGSPVLIRWAKRQGACSCPRERSWWASRFTSITTA